MARVVMFSILSALLGSAALRADDDKKKEPPPAADLLKEGLAKAKKDGKAVFLTFGAPDEKWSESMHKFHARPAAAKILGKHLVFVNVDLTENSGAQDLYLKYAPEDAGVPMWVILSGEGKVLADAMEDVNGEKKNVGFPYEANELTHYEKALRAAVPKLTDDEVKTIMKELKASAPAKD
jgi:hypothetical protein